MDTQTNASTPIAVYQLITEQIIEFFAQGIIPWQKPWKGASMPMNLVSKRQYRGINVWLLVSLNYERNLFLTWDQLKSIGGSVNKDEKAHLVAYWKLPENKTSNNQGGKQPSPRALGYYRVFNIAQCRDIPADAIPTQDRSRVPTDPISICQSILNTMPDMPLITFQGKQPAYYNSENDEIVLPKMKRFKTSELYYRTVFHALIHATGVQKRLDRKTLIDAVPFGTESYAMETLVADMGCALLCALSGIPPCESKDKASAIDSWSEVLRKDTRFITKASGHAQRAVDYILNQQHGESKEEVHEIEESVVS